MTSPSTRRRLLRAVGPTVVTALAGCSSLAGTPTERGPEFDTPPQGECEPVERPMPGPTKGGLNPVKYPDYPDTLTAETARAFARDFEYAYQRNEFVQDNEDTGYDELDVDIQEELAGYPHEETVVERAGGYVVTVVGEMQYGVADRPESATERNARPGRPRSRPGSTWPTATRSGTPIRVRTNRTSSTARSSSATGEGGLVRC